MKGGWGVGFSMCECMHTSTSKQTHKHSRIFGHLQLSCKPHVHYVTSKVYKLKLFSYLLLIDFESHIQTHFHLLTQILPFLTNLDVKAIPSHLFDTCSINSKAFLDIFPTRMQRFQSSLASDSAALILLHARKCERAAGTFAEEKM